MTEAHCALPLPLPTNPAERALLVILRRMAIHGLRDAGGTMVAINHFGTGFRKPLILLRCYLHELATASQRSITVAPCCAPRMGTDEALMLDAVMLSSMEALAALTDADDLSRAFVTAQALGRELRPWLAANAPRR